MVEGHEHNEKVNYWALGVLTYKFIIGLPLFKEMSGYNSVSFVRFPSLSLVVVCEVLVIMI